ncbi:MAG TPA: alanine racemase [Thermoanaerobaculia bacterium]|jgi:D-serine deaminase-like pyridoxal phosphate-dependent protein
MTTNRIHDLPTPAVLVDLDVVEKNVASMQARARASGVKLRPHAKTHKAPRIGRMQIAAGASGLTLAKVSEAEVFAREGFDDIFLGYPIFGADKARRLLALSDRVRLAVGADSEEGARSLGEVFHAAGRRLPVRLKIDCGYHRVGVPPDRALEIARRIAGLPGISFDGLFTHGGQGYGGATPEEVARIGRDEGRIVAETAEALRAAGLPVGEVSLGSTPTVASAVTQRGVTECRPGTYVYNDFSQVSLGSCGFEDCALTVLATVVSVPASDRAVVDAGSKTLSSDPLRPRAGGHGLVLGRKTRVVRLSEEHGVLQVEPGESFRVGERVRILPNHACVVSNLHDRLVGVRGERVEEDIEVAARGCVQ